VNLEYQVKHTLVSRWGELDLNVADSMTGRLFRIQSDTYKMVPSLRVTQDNISQADGSVLHPRWKTGVVAIVQVALTVMLDPSSDTGDDRPACDAEMREMEELLVLHLNAMRKLEANPQRLRWSPTGYGDQRLLDDVQLLDIWDPSYDLSGELAMIQFALESPFPYGIDATEVQTTIPSSGGGSMGGGVTIVNHGNSPQSPVVKVFGPTNEFTLTNNDDLDDQGNPKSLVYTMYRPGGQAIHTGHYAEIDFFRGTIFLDGAGVDLVAGLDPELSDFWALQHGPNDIQIVGADCKVLSNNSWA